MEENKILTFGDIKDFVNKMDDEQLKQQALVWVSDNDHTTDLNAIEELGENKYYFAEHEYSCGRSDFDPDIMCNDEANEQLYKTLDEALENEEYIVTPANRVYFHSFD